jgi:hypothetical protein
MIAESEISLKWPRVQYNHGFQHKNISQTPPLSAPFIHARSGRIAMRDLRLWHAGMLNHTPDPRVMLAFIYFPQWYRPFMHLTLPEECRPIIESWKHVKVNAKYVDGEVDHLKHRVKMNFT